MLNDGQTMSLMTNVAEDAKKSADSLMEQVKAGKIRAQELRNTAIPFSWKRASYEQSFERLLKSKNSLYLQACRGEQE